MILVSHNNNRNNVNTQGFTLLETLVSVGILALVIVGPLAVIMNSSSYARQTKDTVVATYLAEEAIELLQNQYDSLYVYCKKNQGVSPCTGTETTAGQLAWRVFKERLNAGGGQPSCFLTSDGGVTANSDGCSYDFEHMIGDITENPTRYSSSDDECPYLVGATTTIIKPVSEEEGRYQQITRYTYVCKGDIPPGATIVDKKPFTRSVSVEWLPTFDEGSTDFEDHYNDDLRIISSVTYRGINGYPYTVKVTRFMHSRP